MEFRQMRLLLTLLSSFLSIIPAIGQPYIVNIQANTGLSSAGLNDTLFCGPVDDTFLMMQLPFNLPLPGNRSVSEITIVDGIMLMDSMWRWHISPAGFFNAGLDVIFPDSTACLLKAESPDSFCLMWTNVTEYSSDSLPSWRLSFSACLHSDGSWKTHFDTIRNIDSVPAGLFLLVGSGFFSHNYMIPLEGTYVSKDTSGYVASSIPLLFPPFPFYTTFVFSPSPTWTTNPLPDNAEINCVQGAGNMLYNTCPTDIIIYDVSGRKLLEVRRYESVLLPFGSWIIKDSQGKARKINILHR